MCRQKDFHKGRKQTRGAGVSGVCGEPTEHCDGEIGMLEVLLAQAVSYQNKKKLERL